MTIPSPMSAFDLGSDRYMPVDQPVICQLAIPGHAPAQMMHATFVRQTFPRHTHEQFAIGVIDHGAQRFECRHTHFVASAGDVILNNPGDVHTGQAYDATGWTYRMLYLDPEILGNAYVDSSSHVVQTVDFATPVLRDPVLTRTLADLLHSLSDASPQLERDNRLLRLLGMLCERYAGDRVSPSPERFEPRHVAQVAAYLHDHLTDEISLDQLANLTGLGRFRLLRSFQAATGLPPYAYLVNLRVENARQLITTGVSLADSAVRSGFHDQSHLNRHFKRIFGYTPGTYQRACFI